MDTDADVAALRATNTPVKAVPPKPATPIVCTLGKREAADQLLEWVDLRGHALTVHAIDGGARMTFLASLVSDVEDLVRREASCCAFLVIETSVDDDVLTVVISSPSDEALPVISALAGLATS